MGEGKTGTDSTLSVARFSTTLFRSGCGALHVLSEERPENGGLL
jgi:hypothetical protein